MKKLFKTIPSDWLYQLVTLSLITTFTFYLLEIADDFKLTHEFWGLHDRLYLYTFLGIQFVVKVFFYWGLFLIFKKALFRFLRKKSIHFMRQFHSWSDKKTIVEIKELLVTIFGMLDLQRQDLDDIVVVTEEQADRIMKNGVKWFCVFIHLALTAILVWHQNMWFVLPLLIVILFIIIAYWIGVNLLFSNAKIVEKAKKELDR